ncbi:anti-sigma factor family protein [Actinomadura rayongensis]|uniref:anti-sigma factor family protein n=1 Tax=Actinomadura rayongensis TaxID=1429076 RepID=UPI00301E1833
MSCLGERLTALVDGELDAEERERAHAHLARCADCRAEAEVLRGLKNRLRGLAAPDAGDAPSGDFLARLNGLAEPAPACGPVRAPRPARPVRPRDTRPRDNRRSDNRRGDGRPGGRPGTPADRRNTRRTVVAVGAATLFLGLGGGAYIAGGRQNAPQVSPAFDRFAVEHSLLSGESPVSDPLTDPSTLQTAVPLPTRP